MLTGNTLGPFEIEKEIGSGAMGTVYRAKYTKTGQCVALKLISQAMGTNPRVLARFEREAEILKHLKHPNIVRLLGIGKHRGSPYFAMELIDGETVEDLLARRDRLTWEEVIELGKQVAAALRVAHAQGIIHRDLKPANLMLTRANVIKLTDFGIAKDMDATGLTSANCTVGTAAYMSPEQCRGERDITHKSDLYSFGVMLYELLTGSKPFVAENVMDMFVQHTSGTFVRPSQRVMDVPIWLDTLVCQLMEKKPEQRPLDAATVEQALEEIRAKVDALKSAGVEAATKTARRGTTAQERETARAIVAGSRRKKLRKKRTPWALIGQGAALFAGLVGIGLLLYFAVLRPDSPEKLLREGVKHVNRGDELLAEGDDFAAWQRWDTAKAKFLNRVVDLDPDGPHGAAAKAALAHLEAGSLYLKGRNDIRELVERKEWKTVRPRKGLDYYHDVLDNFPGDPIAAKIRSELGPLESPALLEEAEKNADPSIPFPADLSKLEYQRPDTWRTAFARLEQLLRWYPESESGRNGADLQARLNAHERGLQKILEARKLGQTPSSLELGQREALPALLLELHAAVEKDKTAQDELVRRAESQWRQLAAWGKDRSREGKPYRDDPEARPWVLLAEAKVTKFDEHK